MSQSFTFIDVGGNQAQYTIDESDGQNHFRWSTEHGGSGAAATFEQAQYEARVFLKDSMCANRRSEEVNQARRYASRWR